MASVQDIMTPQLFSLWPDDSAAEALDYLGMLNIHAAPVLDEETHEPLGVISIGDLTGNLATARVRDRMSTPARVTIDTAAVRDAADQEHARGGALAEDPVDEEVVAEVVALAGLEGIGLWLRGLGLGLGDLGEHELEPLVDIVGTRDGAQLGRERDEVREVLLHPVVDRAGVEVVLVVEAAGYGDVVLTGRLAREDIVGEGSEAEDIGLRSARGRVLA